MPPGDLCLRLLVLVCQSRILLNSSWSVQDCSCNRNSASKKKEQQLLWRSSGLPRERLGFLQNCLPKLDLCFVSTKTFRLWAGGGISLRADVPTAALAMNTCAVQQ